MISDLELLERCYGVMISLVPQKSDNNTSKITSLNVINDSKLAKTFYFFTGLTNLDTIWAIRQCLYQRKSRKLYAFRTWCTMIVFWYFLLIIGECDL